MVKAHAGILETDTEDEAQRKLRDVVVQTVGADDVEWTLTHLRPLAGVEDAAERSGSQDEAFTAWRGFLEGIADESTLVLVFEDLHWADDGLLDFVDHLVDWATRRPAARRRYRPPGATRASSGWGGGKTNALTLSLAPFRARRRPSSSTRCSSGPRSPPMSRQRCSSAPAATRCMPRSSCACSTSAPRAPASPRPCRASSPPGSTSSTGTRRSCSRTRPSSGGSSGSAASGSDREAAEAALHRLERREFVQRERRSTVAGETEYAFRHALVREVAYEQIPRAQRGEKHRRAADWLETLGRSEDLAELLAHHYIAVLEYSEPDAELTARAGRALTEAGDRALALNAYGTAARFYRRAMDLAAEDKRGRVLFGLGSALEALADPQAGELLVEASAQLAAEDDPETAAEAETLLAQIAWTTGDAAGVVEHSRASRRARPRAASVRRARKSAGPGRPLRDARRPLERGRRDGKGGGEDGCRARPRGDSS